MQQRQFAGAGRCDQDRSGAKREQAVACQLRARRQGPTHRHDYARHGLPQTARLCARRFSA